MPYPNWGRWTVSCFAQSQWNETIINSVSQFASGQKSSEQINHECIVIMIRLYIKTDALD